MEIEPQEHTENLTRIATGAEIGLVGGIAGYGLNYAFMLLAARTLGADTYGLFVLGLTIAQVSSLVALIGLDQTAVRYGALYLAQEDEARTKGTILFAVLASLVSSIVFALAAWSLADLMAVDLFGKPDLAPVLRLLSISIPAFSLSAAALAATQAFKTMRYTVCVNSVFRPGMQILMTLALFLAGWRLRGVVVGYLLSSLGSAALALFFLNHLFPLRGQSTRPVFEIRALLGFAAPALPLVILNRAMGQLEPLILGYFLDAGAVGVYSVSLKLTFVGSIILVAFNRIFAPHVSAIFSQGKLTELSRLFQTITKWAFAMCLPVFLGLIIFAKPIIGIFGHEFQVGASSLVVLSLAQLVNVGVGSVGVLLIMSGKPIVELLNGVFFVALNVALDIALIPQYGILGAAIANGFTIALLNITRLVEVFVLLRLQPYNRTYLKPLGAGGVAAVALGLAASIWPVDGWTRLAFYLTALGAVYLLSWLAMGLADDDRAAVALLKRHLLTARAG